MTTVLHISFNFSALRTTHGGCCKKPIYYNSLSSSKIGSLRRNGLKPRVSRGERWFSLGGSWGRDAILLEEGWKRNRRIVLVRFNQGFGFNGGGGGGGGGGRDNARLLGNIAFAIGLTYLSVTGQLGWVLDAIVSIWLIAVLIPIVGLGAFLWWAGRDVIQGQCPNCGNDFQVFKSTLNDELQLCPFCTQPFSGEAKFWNLLLIT
ncbi:hypothetical protein HS088_TW19G00245 [Tripterygium wilfordii]|uniref:Transmembrane protein n=1 Tax=Tripterygium wilfordii TaxID=458696 RepID=A0A7J7C932_TRIWF|nr:hypothetical protein HS088_TW19G00245 [Tripterygium wilfordii]